MQFLFPTRRRVRVRARRKPKPKAKRQLSLEDWLGEQPPDDAAEAWQRALKKK